MVGPLTVPAEEFARILSYFAPPNYEVSGLQPNILESQKTDNANFARWCSTNLAEHKQPGYSIITISLKPVGAPPGDATATQMDLVADLGERYSHDEVRVTHEQNLVLPHVRTDEVYLVWQQLVSCGLGTPNVGLITDMITCPGLDYCNLANARSIPVAQDIARRFEDIELQHDIGELSLIHI